MIHRYCVRAVHGNIRNICRSWNVVPGPVGSGIEISAGGVLFHTKTALDVGTVIGFRIVLPASVLGTDTDVLVNCSGRVVRSLDEKGKKSVAAVIDEYCFERVYSHAG